MTTRARGGACAGRGPAGGTGEAPPATPQRRARYFEAALRTRGRAARGRGAAGASPVPPAAPRLGRTRRLALAALAAAQLAWLDPHHKAREGNRQFAAGKYDEAAARYNEGLVDQPDSALLHFNLGDAAYKQGKYDEALTAFEQVPAGDDDKARAARVAYNIGNVKFRLGEAAGASEPQKTLGLWAEALASYRRALGAAPDDLDAKVNHELVERRIAELKKKLEEQQKEQEQKQQEQNQDQQNPDEQKDQQQGDQQQQEKQEDKGDQQDQAQKQEQPREQPEPPENQQQPGGQQEQRAQEGDKKDELSPQEAAALLDTQREQEVRPDEVVKKLQGAGIAGPAQDW